MSEHVLDIPFTRDLARRLKLGDLVYLRGAAVVTAGYPTHERLVDCIENDLPVPVAPDGAFFHLGCMSRLENGVRRPLYVNPTTSTRFNAFIPAIVRHFRLTALGGKGGLDARSIEAMRETGCVYLAITGGAAPILTEGVAEVIETGWDDLIAQFRLNRLRLDMFGPLTVAIDAHGNSIYAELAGSARRRLPEILRGLANERGSQNTHSG